MNRPLKWLFFASLALAMLLWGAAFYGKSATVLADTAVQEETVCDLADLSPDDELTIQVRFFCDPEGKIKPVTLLQCDNGLQVRFTEKRALEFRKDGRCIARHTVPSATGIRHFTLHYRKGTLAISQNYSSSLSQMPEQSFLQGRTAPDFRPRKLWLTPSQEVEIRRLTIRTGNWGVLIFYGNAFAVFFAIAAAGIGAAMLCRPRENAPSETDTVCTAAIAAFGSTALVLLCGAMLYFPEVKVPDLSGLLISAAETCPEPKEQFLYLLALLCGGTASLVFARGATRKKYVLPGAPYFALAVLLCFCAGAVLLHFCRFPGALCCFAGAAAAAVFLTFHDDPVSGKTAAVFCGATGLFFLWTWGQQLFSLPRTISVLHHYCAVVHSLYLAAYGYVPFADFQSQYGLYSLFPAPLFRIIPVSLDAVALLFLLLILTTAGAFFLLLRRCCRNVFLPFLGTAAILAMYTGMLYLQQMPLRTLFPALLLLFVRHESEAPSKRRAFCGTVLASLAMLWSPDTGAVLLTAHTFFLGYLVWEKEPDSPLAAKLLALLKMALRQLSVLVLTILLFLGICKLTWGKIPDLRLLFQYSMIFGKTGFFSLPMPGFGAWMVPAAIYCTGLCFAFYRLFSGNREEPWLARFVFFCSLLGCGIASYYVGRSHDDNIPAILYPALLLLTLFSDSETGRKRCWRLLLLTILLFPLFRTWVLPLQHCFTEKELGQMRTADGICDTFARQLNRKQGFLAMLPMGTYYALRLGMKPLCGYTSFEESLFREEAERTLKRLLEDRTLRGTGIVAAGNYKACPSAKKLTDFVARRTRQNLPENAILYLTLPLETACENKSATLPQTKKD